ncbi:MAG: hypothetical protein JZU49_00780, partial [Sulfuricurvum sp.]|nr:hypothetical protein [Sulfuricurvum sp.]
IVSTTCHMRPRLLMQDWQVSLSQLGQMTYTHLPRVTIKWQTLSIETLSQISANSDLGGKKAPGC